SSRHSIPHTYPTPASRILHPRTEPCARAQQQLSFGAVTREVPGPNRPGTSRRSLRSGLEGGAGVRRLNIRLVAVEDVRDAVAGGPSVGTSRRCDANRVRDDGQLSAVSATNPLTTVS